VDKAGKEHRKYDNHLNPLSRGGQIEISGNNLSGQFRVFEADFDPNKAGTFLLDLFDCDYGKKVDMPDEILLCGPGYINGSEGFARYSWNDSFSGQSYYVEHSGFQYLEVKDEYGCMSHDSVYVHVIPDPVVVIEGNDMICPDGGSTLLFVDSKDQIRWNTGAGDQMIFVDEVGLYSVTVTDQYGCIYTSEIEIGVYESFIPHMDDYYMATAQDTINLYPGDYLGYRWSNGETTPCLVIAGNTMKEGIHLMGLEVQDFNGCFYHHEFSVEIFQLKSYSSGNPAISQPDQIEMNGLSGFDGIIGFDPEELSTGGCDIRISPNPGKDIFQVRVFVDEGFLSENTYGEDNHLLVFGSRGEFVEKLTMSSEIRQYNLNLQGKVLPGTYYIALQTGNSICSIKKLVVLP
jgi:hypothetical protein